MDAKCPSCGKIYHNHNPKNLYTRCWSCYKYFYLPEHLIDNSNQEDKAMGTQLDLDDVAATSELAKKQLAQLRAENQRIREALELLLEYAQEDIAKARAALGKDKTCNQ
jgi:predicted  nucleic acid-binding Zn-ribbon protein